MESIKGIVYNNQAQADTLKLRLKNKVKHLFTGKTTDYTYTITHPTTGDVAVIIEEKGTFWDLIYEDLNPNDIDNLIELDSSWFPNIDLI